MFRRPTFRWCQRGGVQLPGDATMDCYVYSFEAPLAKLAWV